MTQHPSLLGMNHLIGENIQKHVINLYHIDILKLRKSSLPPFPPFSLPHFKNSQSNINFTIVGQHSVHTFVSANHLIIAFFNPSEYLNIFDIHHSKHLKCCNTVLLNEFQKKKLMMTFRAGGVNHISFLCFNCFAMHHKKCTTFYNPSVYVLSKYFVLPRFCCRHPCGLHKTIENITY